MAGSGKSSEDVEGEDFAGLALGDDIEGAAADLAVGGEALMGLGGVEDQLEALATEGAGDVRRAFHGGYVDWLGHACKEGDGGARMNPET